jgi:GNAT superfamily N-acetyltransferase
MNQKLIMEGWREFLGLVDKKKTSDFNLAQTCMIVLGQKGSRKKIILYNPRDLTKLSRDDMRENGQYKEAEIIGGIDLVLSTKISPEPCIANTYQITAIYVTDAHRGKGLQKQLMDIAFYMVSEEGAGLTSDHHYGTRPKAGGAWKKIEKSPDYEKKTTNKGNDTFDYEDVTPDPNDDCNNPSRDPAATDHSFEKKSNSIGKKLFDNYGTNHKVITDFLKSKFMKIDNFEYTMADISDNKFRDAYADS